MNTKPDSKSKRGFRITCSFLSSDESPTSQVLKAELEETSAGIASVHLFYLLHCPHVVP